MVADDDFTRYLTALQISATRLAALAQRLPEGGAEQPSYASEWTIADAFSHLGSGATIMLAGMDASIDAESLPDGFNQGVWDEWNAKAPADQVRDAVAADAALVERLASLTDDERERVALPFGPMQLGAAQFAAMRLNEHALHTWDIEVALDPSATIPADVAGPVVDNLEVIAGFAGKPTGVERTVHVHTADPFRAFELSLAPESVALGAAEPSPAPDLVLPAESLARLVYGRLDADHAPAVDAADLLDELRSVFPGF
ncbi:MAG: maleylpyruvate isomerase family mycothiol-dependent enzyme [Aquihabitans sp.]